MRLEHLNENRLIAFFLLTLSIDIENDCTRSSLATAAAATTAAIRPLFHFFRVRLAIGVICSLYLWLISRSMPMHVANGN